MINGKRVIAIIPARAGSTGCPGKNYRIIHGKPLVIWSVEAALRSRFIDTVVVSSNCPEVFKAVDDVNWDSYLQNGHDIHYLKRPDEISTSSSSTEDAIAHVLQCFHPYDIVVLLQPTSPARRNNLVDKCIVELDEYHCDSVFTCESKTPFMYQKNRGTYQTLCVWRDGKMIVGPDKRPMRQEMTDDVMYFHDNGNVYAFTVDSFEEYGRRIGENFRIVSTDFFENIQIDTEDDFKVVSSLVDNVYGDFL